MIDEFKQLLQKFVKKECGIDEVTTNLQQLLKKHPQLATPIQGQIDQLAKDNRIDQSAVDAIRQITSSYAETDDSDKTVIATDDDKTEISDQSPAGNSNDDATVLEDDDATQINDDISGATVLEDNDATLVSDTQVPAPDDGFDLDIDNTGSNTSATSPTIGPDGMPVMAHGDEIIGVGSILRNRFELIGKLGEGGMGAVFVAIDKIKEEAQDKNPKVAVKVLNETFKQFRESFIALQRESSKQQRLAHPNIATVFDFDRDYTYGTVFMTMEMLEGDPLDKYIRRVPKEGLSYAEAKPLIDGMCNGLAYAHHHDLVHSDFKPANIFLNKDGVVKLLDFGIARAAKPKFDADGKKETTLFDPGTLGALTPAYASTEMLEGETPEPPDDIYALAAVTYQLLGGKHPFNKMPANQAKDNHLKPAPIKKLKRRQWKALEKGLAFDRDKRTQTVDEFLEGITPKKPIVAYILTTAFVMLAIIGVLSKGVIEDHFRNERNKEMSATLIDAGANKNTEQLVGSLNTLATYDGESQDLIKADPDVKNSIVDYFTRRIDKQIDKKKGKYDYPGASRVMAEARSFYADSGALDSKQEDVDNRKVAELETQRDLYTRFLKIGPWLPVDGQANDIPDVVATIRTIDPENSLLTDPRLVGSYIKEAKTAREDAKFPRSEALLTQAGTFTDDKDILTNEFDQLAYSKHLSGNQVILQSLLYKVKPANASKGLKQALTVSDELGQIRLLAPENEYLAATGKIVSASLLKNIKVSKKQSSLGPIAGQFQKLATALAPDQQNKIRGALDAAWQKAGGVDPSITQEKQQTASTLEDQITEISGKAEFSHEWTQSLQSLTQEMVALLGKDHVSTQQAQRQLATQFMQEATAVSEAGRLVQSGILIEHAKYFDTTAPGLADAAKAIAAALEKQELEQIEIERLATVSALKQDTLYKAKSEKVDDALRFLDLLKVYLLPDDPFLITEGPEAIGNAYAGIALRAKKRADGIRKNYVGQRDAYTDALETIKTGLEIAPDSRPLTSARANIQNALTITEVRNTFNTSEKLDLAGLRTQLNRIKAYNASVFIRLQTEFSESVAQRISTMESYDPKSAKIFLDAAKKLPINQVLLSRIRVVVPEPSKYSKQITELIKVSKLTEASKILKKALAEESDHADIKRLRGILANKVTAANKAYKQYQAALRKNDVGLSKKLIARALKIWVDNTEFNSAFKSIKISIIASKAVCQTRLAGYGRRSRGRCYDMVSSTVKGPIMVVLPAGAGHDLPFAISKFEISVSEFNQYCKKTKKCQAINGGAKLPVTGISLAQAKAYTAWLSKISGAKYRLPTDKEWVYAANAAGKQPKGKSYNCTLRLGGKIMKGTGLEDVNTGKQNGWGLANYIGNAQEWVDSPSGVKVRGGAYSDAMKECTVELERAHDGNPDKITSFRIVRDVT